MSLLDPLVRRKLGCPEGRSAASWVDYNLFGHQIVCHEIKGYNAASSANDVDGDPVPIPHFGLALSTEQFHQLASRVKEADIQFVLEPHLRFQGLAAQVLTTTTTITSCRGSRHCMLTGKHKEE